MNYKDNIIDVLEEATEDQLKFIFYFCYRYIGNKRHSSSDALSSEENERS